MAEGKRNKLIANFIVALILLMLTMYGCGNSKSIKDRVKDKRAYIERDLKSFDKIYMEKKGLKIWLERDWKDREEVVIYSQREGKDPVEVTKQMLMRYLFIGKWE